MTAAAPRDERGAVGDAVSAASPVDAGPLDAGPVRGGPVGASGPPPRGGGARALLRDALLVAALAIAALLGASAGTSWVQDDVSLVAENPRLLVRDAAGLRALLRDRYWDRRRPHERLWRPLPTASLALDLRLWGADPDALRRVNIALHALVSVCVWLVLRALLPGRAALVGGLLFAAHPVHAEAVATAVGRCELLALLGAALAFLAHLRARAARPLAAAAWVLLAALGFLCAWLSKESALVAPGLLALLELARRGEGIPAGWRRRAALVAPYLVYAAALALYGWARWVVLRGEPLPLEGAWALGRRPLDERGLMACDLAREALFSLLLPLRTSGSFPPPASQLGSQVLLGLALHAGLLGLGLRGLLGADRVWRAAGAGVLGTYLALLPALNLVPIGVARADRLLYAPSLFAALTVAAGLTLALRERRPPARRRAAWTVALAALLLGALPRLSENVRAWTDARRLWSMTLERFPDAGRAHLELARLEAREVERDPAARGRALEHLRRAVAVFEPRRELRAAAEARCALARMVTRSDPGEAIVLYEEARAIDPSQLEAYQELVAIYVARSATREDEGTRVRDLRLAERVARKAANHVAPYAYGPWLQLGQVLAAMGQRDEEAADALSRAVERSSDPWEAHLARARLRARRAGPATALSDYEALLGLIRERPEPERLAALPDALLGCALGLRATGRADEAAPLEEELRERFPESPAARALPGGR
ncbi:MAG: tetratricopeptide repeat protein [Planctomycetota bacterium]